MLFSAGGWGLYAVMVGRYMKGYPARLAFGIICLYTMGGLLVMMFLFGDWGRVGSLSTGAWSLVLLSAILGIALGHILYYTGIQSIGPVATEGAYSLIPFIAAFYAFVFLGEYMRPWQWFGGTLLVICCTLMVIIKFNAKKENTR